MTIIPAATRLGAMLAISAFLVPVVRGEVPQALLAAGVPALKAGDAVKLDAIAAATFLKGSAPAKWETDKLYIFECWATWCGPCIDQIPHLNALHRKFKDKGVFIYGMNVLEDDKAKIEGFVKKQGDGMSYPVALDGKQGPFVMGWLLAAGVNGIPRAFVVKNGKLLFHLHPGELTDDAVTALLAGGEQEAAVTAKFAPAAPVKTAKSEGTSAGDLMRVEVNKLTASATELGKAGKQEEAERQLDAYLGKSGNAFPGTMKAFISLETMTAYFTAAKDEAGAAKYAEKLAANYPDALPTLSDGGAEGLKTWMVEQVKGDKPKK